MRHPQIPPTLAALIVALTVLPTPAVRGQDRGTTQPTSQPKVTADVAATELTPKGIEARIRQVEAAKDMKEAVKAELLSLYRQALGQLQVSQTWSAKLAQLEQARQKAPVELAGIRARLERAKTQPASQPLPERLGDAALEELQQKLDAAEMELRARQQAAKKAEDDAKRWSERRASLPKELVTANARREQLAQEISALEGAGIAPEVAQARETALSANQKAVELEIRTYEAELRLYDDFSDLFSARGDETRRNVAESEFLVAALQKAVGQRRQAEADRQKREAQAQLTRLRESDAELAAIAEKNNELAAELRELPAKIKEVTTQSEAVEDTVAALDKDLRSLQDRAATEGMASYIGPLFVKHRKQLPDAASHRRMIRAIKRKVSSVQVRLLELEEQRAGLAELDKRIARFLDGLLERQPHLDRASTEMEVRDLFEKRLDTLESLRQGYDRYWNSLVGLNVAEHRLLDKTKASRQFIDERALWIPSNVPLTKAQLPERLTPRPGTGQRIGESLLHDARNRPIVYSVAAAMLLLWIVLARSVRIHRRRIDQRVAHPYTDSFGLTLGALGVDVFLSLPAPAVLWFIASRLSVAVPVADADVYDFAQALARGLSYPALELFALLLVRRLCRRKGIAVCHFRWDADAVQTLRRTMSFLIVVGIPVSCIANFSVHHPDDAWTNLVGGVLVILGMLVSGFLLHKILHPTRGVLARQAHTDGPGRSRPLMLTCYLAVMGVVLALAIASAVGYQHTAVEFERRLLQTVWLVFILVLLRAVAVRFVLVAQQRLAIRRAKQEQAARQATEHAAAQAAGDAANVDGTALSYEAIGDQTRTLLRWLVAYGLILGVWGIWQDVFPAFSFVNRFELWNYTVQVAVETDAGEQATPPQTRTEVVSVHFSDLLLAIILAGATIVLARNGPKLVEMLLLLRLPIDAGARFATTALLRYAILIVGFVLAFNAVGIGWGKVQWLAAAMTVGLAFGLQEIFANFVSGLIILFERPIRIGDVVTVGNVDGKITRISMRATAVTDWDRRELIVPNKTFITNEIVNWTHSDPVTRVVVPVGIAYGSDTRLARDMLLKAAQECDPVLDKPAPMAIFRGFGDSALDFELRVFIPSRDVWPQMMDELHTRIDDEFRQAGIEIAFPQHDIHLRSVKDVLPITQGGQQYPSSPGSDSVSDTEPDSGGAGREEPDA